VNRRRIYTRGVGEFCIVRRGLHGVEEIFTSDDVGALGFVPIDQVGEKNALRLSTQEQAAHVRAIAQEEKPSLLAEVARVVTIFPDATPCPCRLGEDVVVRWLGAMVLLFPRTWRARGWLCRELRPEHWIDGGVPVDFRFAQDIIDGLRASGLGVAS
jgi:hypothetical protein